MSLWARTFKRFELIPRWCIITASKQMAAAQKVNKNEFNYYRNVCGFVAMEMKCSCIKVHGWLIIWDPQHGGGQPSLGHYGPIRTRLRTRSILKSLSKRNAISEYVTEQRRVDLEGGWSSETPKMGVVNHPWVIMAPLVPVYVPVLFSRVYLSVMRFPSTTQSRDESIKRVVDHLRPPPWGWSTILGSLWLH
jgi:hypothetical protein